jgi:hypothetical protein
MIVEPRSIPRLLPLAALVFLGCSGTDPGLAAVSGTVTLGDAPLANATITFIPKDGTPGFGGVGKTNGEGKYTIAGSRENEKGIPPGEYRVVISKRLMPDGSELPADDKTPPMMSPAKESLAGTYSSMTSTTLTATVPAGGATLDFALKESKKK